MKVIWRILRSCVAFPAAHENTAPHSCSIQPYYLLTHQILYIYIYITRVLQVASWGVDYKIIFLLFMVTTPQETQLTMCLDSLLLS